MKLAFADWGDIPVLAINRTMIERLFTALSAPRSPVEAGTLSKLRLVTANRHFRILRAVINFAMEKYSTSDGEPLIPSNPVTLLSVLRKWHRIERRTRHIRTASVAAMVRGAEHGPDLAGTVPESRVTLFPSWTSRVETWLKLAVRRPAASMPDS
jgi:hypothetical protein